MNVIANPASRAKMGKRHWSFWQARLRACGIPFSWHESKSVEDCERLARESSTLPVVAVGGDGTINAVINGCMRSATSPAMGVLYAGTSPDFCKFHAIPIDREKALDTLLAGRQRPVDLGMVEFTRHGQATTRYFACGCNIGLGAAVAGFANVWRKFLGDTLGTGLGLIWAMFRHAPFASTLTVDGENYAFPHTNHIIVLKNPHVASSLWFDLDLEPDDGRMYVIVIHRHSLWGLFGLIRSLYSGALPQKKKMFSPALAPASVSLPHPGKMLNLMAIPTATLRPR